MNAIQPPAQELEVAHTAIVLHWDGAYSPGNSPQSDRTFITPGILQGELLHQHVDALLEEHAPATDGSIDCITDVSVFWHHPDGRWELEEFVSHYYAAG
jgi:hypothetical protein